MNKKPFLHIRFDEYGKALDYSENRHPIDLAYREYIDNGDGKVSKYSFFTDGRTTDRYMRPKLGENLSPPFTWCAWLMKQVHNPSNYPIFMSFQLPYIACNSSTHPFRLSLRVNGSQQHMEGTTIPQLNEWYHVAMVFGQNRTQLYVNGELENESTSLISDETANSEFDIGTHYSNSSAYVNTGRYDDIRIYKEALKQEDIQQIMNCDSDKKRMTFHSNGDVSVRGIEENVEWTLLDNFISDLDNGVTPWDNALGGNAINNTTDLTNAGWTHSLTTIETGNYHRERGFLQMFGSGPALGYIEKTLPAGYDWVKVKWGNWYHGPDTQIRMNGTIVSVLETNQNRAEFVSQYSGTPTIRIEETGGIFWVSEIWVGKSNDNAGPIVKDDRRQSPHFIYNSYSPNLHPYDDWTAGTSGSDGAFSHNGSVGENHRVIMPDPWGNPTVVWECRPDSVSGPDGGWNHTAIPIDNTKMYRYSVWMMRNTNTGGSFYHGCHGYGSTNGVLHRGNGGNQTNPYFWSDSSSFTVWRWQLIVGHIWPAGSGTGSQHPDSGRYDLNRYRGTISADWVWRPETTTGRGRNYLFYSTNTSQRQWMVYPMFEVCDGTEAPIEDLLQGRAYGPSGKIESNLIDMGNKSQIYTDDGYIRIKGRLLIT